MTVPLPPPTLARRSGRGGRRRSSCSVAGDERSVENFVRDSVSAPFVLKTRDVKAGDATIRVADLWFVVRGDLDEIDLKHILGKTGESTVEAGNMRFTTKILSAGLEGSPARPVASGRRARRVVHPRHRALARPDQRRRHRPRRRHPDGRLAHRGARDQPPRFDADPAFPNHWSTISVAQPARPPERPRFMPGEGVTSRSPASPRSRGPCSSRLTLRSSSPSPGLRATRSSGPSSA